MRRRCKPCRPTGRPAAPGNGIRASANRKRANGASASSACRSSRNRQSSSRRTGLWRALAGGPSKAEDLEQSEPAPVSDSYAERRDTDATAQMPSKWPGAKAGHAAQSAAGETALRYFSILGIVVIPLLLAAGWVAKYAREPHRSNLQERLRTLANSLRPRRRSEAFDEAMFVGSAPPLSPATSRRRAGADLAQARADRSGAGLKTSLAELMHDLSPRGRTARTGSLRGASDTFGRMTGRSARHCSPRNKGGAGVARVGPGFGSMGRPDERRGERSRTGGRGVCRFSRGSPVLNPGYPAFKSRLFV